VNDYRANEKTFSLLTQVVGRSGRGEREGRAIIQTYTPDNDTIKLAAKQDYKGFYESEIRLRELQQSPPFQELYSITVSGTDESEVIRCCRYIDQVLTKWENERPDLHVLGIAPYHIVMVNRHFRYRVSIRCNGDRDIRQRLASIVIYCSKNKKFKGVSVFAESNPLE
jgi:primosomal protein N' (replication factor Y)